MAVKFLLINERGKGMDIGYLTSDSARYSLKKL